MMRARIAKRFANFDLDFEMEADAGVTVLFGASGAGKTLTLDCLAGLIQPDSGRILLNDRILFDAAAGVNLRPRDRNCGYVFQDRALFPHMTVRQNLLFAADRKARLERHRRVAEMMERFHIAELANRRPRELSGGEKQRCSIARALIGEPMMLLLDEPAQGLDLALRNELYGIVRQARAEYGIPIVLVTHDLEECFVLGDTMLILERGRLLQSGAPTDLYRRPGSPEAARLLGIANVFEAEVMALDPGRDTCKLRTMEQELTGAYLPGRLIGDRLRICVPAVQLRIFGVSGPNRIPARLVQVTELSDSVRLRFEPEMTVEVSHREYEAHGQTDPWFVEIPARALGSALR